MLYCIIHKTRTKNEKTFNSKIKPQAEKNPWVLGQNALSPRQGRSSKTPQKKKKSFDRMNMRPLALPKSLRILKPQDFKRVFRQGKRVACDGLSLYFLPNDLGKCRLGISAPKAAFKKSHNRNKIRRLIKEAYRKNRHAIKEALDIVFLAKSGAESFDYGRAQERVLLLLKKTGANKQAND